MDTPAKQDEANTNPMGIHAASLRRQARRLAGMPEPAWLNQEVGRRLADKLDAMRMQPQHWLDWSAWLGASASVVSQRYPQAKRWLWEPTPALMQRAQQALLGQSDKASSGLKALWAGLTSPKNDGQVAGLIGDQDWPAHWPAQMDMLWANMALHTLVDPAATCKRWSSALASGGFLMCSGLGPDSFKELRLIYKEMGWGAPTVAFMDMHDIGDVLVHAGFSEPVMDMEHLTLSWSSAEALLSEMRTWGGNVSRYRSETVRGRRWRNQLLQLLEKHLSGPDGRLSLTVEIIYGHAMQPTTRASVDVETRISLSDMKRWLKK